MEYKAVRRDWLRKQVEAGKIEVKCNFYLTDDYAFDNANKGGTTDWMPARIKHPKYEKHLNQWGYEDSHVVDDDCPQGFMNFWESDFSGKSGSAYWENDTLIRFRIHSNASYTMRVKTTKAEQGKQPKPRIRIMAIARQIA